MADNHRQTPVSATGLLPVSRFTSCSASLREAADLMVGFGVGRLPVVSRATPKIVIGILTRSDLLAAHARRPNENDRTGPRLKIPFVRIVRV